MNINMNTYVEDWCSLIKQFLEDPKPETNLDLKWQAIRYVLIDQQLYKITKDEVFLRCVNMPEDELIMLDVHKGLCRALKVVN